MGRPRKTIINRVLLMGAILFLPALFLIIFSSGKQQFTPPPYLGPKIPVVEDGELTGDSSHFIVPDFDLALLDGRTVPLSNYDGKIIVAMVTGISCPKDCEIQPEAIMKILLKEIKGNDSYNDVVILSELVNYDSNEPVDVSKLNSYYTNQIDPKQWKFFTCKKNELYNFEPYPGTETGNLLESSIAGARNGKTYYNIGVLLDKERHVRGLYNLNNSEYIRDLLDGIKLLKKEEDYENT